MSKLQGLVLLGCIALSGFTVACGQQAETPSAQSAAPANSQTATSKPEKSDSEGFAALKTVISQTTAAVNSGDFKAARTEYSQFEASWSKVEDALKAKSGEAYGRVEDGMDKVGQALKPEQPKKEATIAALKELEVAINSAASL